MFSYVLVSVAFLFFVFATQHFESARLSEPFLRLCLQRFLLRARWQVEGPPVCWLYSFSGFSGVCAMRGAPSLGRCLVRADTRSLCLPNADREASIPAQRPTAEFEGMS